MYDPDTAASEGSAHSSQEAYVTGPGVGDRRRLIEATLALIDQIANCSEIMAFVCAFLSLDLLAST